MAAKPKVLRVDRPKAFTTEPPKHVTYGHRHRKWRKRVLRNEPCCRDCWSNGIVKASREAHHIRKVADYPDLRFDETNGMGLCTKHHSIRTARGE